jgi:hypothetical protein
MTTIQNILQSGINEQNAEQLKRIVAEKCRESTLKQFQEWAEAHALPTTRTKSGTLKAINGLIDNQSILSVQTGR